MFAIIFYHIFALEVFKKLLYNIDKQAKQSTMHNTTSHCITNQNPYTKQSAKQYFLHILGSNTGDTVQSNNIGIINWVRLYKLFKTFLIFGKYFEFCKKFLMSMY